MDGISATHRRDGYRIWHAAGHRTDNEKDCRKERDDQRMYIRDHETQTRPGSSIHPQAEMYQGCTGTQSQGPGAPENSTNWQSAWYPKAQARPWEQHHQTRHVGHLSSQRRPLSQDHVRDCTSSRRWHRQRLSRSVVPTGYRCAHPKQTIAPFSAGANPNEYSGAVQYLGHGAKPVGTYKIQGDRAESIDSRIQ